MNPIPKYCLGDKFYCVKDNKVYEIVKILDRDINNSQNYVLEYAHNNSIRKVTASEYTLNNHYFVKLEEQTNEEIEKTMPKTTKTYEYNDGTSKSQSTSHSIGKFYKLKDRNQIFELVGFHSSGNSVKLRCVYDVNYINLSGISVTLLQLDSDFKELIVNDEYKNTLRFISKLEHSINALTLQIGELQGKTKVVDQEKITQIIYNLPATTTRSDIVKAIVEANPIKSINNIDETNKNGD